VSLATNRDFRDLFFELNKAEARYLVVGAYAVTFHSHPRYTKDLDVWVEPTEANAQRVWAALAAFGAPMDRVRPADLAKPGVVFQIGVEPNRIDILTRVTGVEFGAAWPRRVSSPYADGTIQILSREDLLRNKRAVGRPQDLLDADSIERNPGRDRQT
jgi:hypothetical protein